MAGSEDPVDFDIIEGQKENIQSLPGGRSARTLAQIYSPNPLRPLATPTPSESRSANDRIRDEYEAEVQNISESDDPLDVYDRYIRWTLETYPSAQATPESQLNILLERATRAFIGSAQYKNDPRYLKMWIHYIHFFADSPRETYVFLSRHGIGEGLALYYEEFAEWLEAAKRWSQAEEIYKLGIEREARPVQRLLRKFKEFEERLAQQPEGSDEPSSPALPKARPALAARTDPFAAVAADPQAPRPGASASGSSKPAKAKMAIFSDADAKPPAMSSRDASSRGWDTMGTAAERKKENSIAPKPWAGETLRAGGKKPAAAAKMAVFRDKSQLQINNIVVVPSKNQVTVHPQTGKRERIFVNLSVIYPTPEEPGTELGFEEVWAANRGWLDYCWEDEEIDASVVPEPSMMEEDDVDRGMQDRLVIRHDKMTIHKDEKISIHRDTKVSIHRDDKLPIHSDENMSVPRESKMTIHRDENMSSHKSQKLAIHQDVLLDENGGIMEQPKPRGKKKKVIEDNKTQIIKTKLDSPSGPKLRKKNTSEPTMTLHTKGAMDDIYDIFNAPLKKTGEGEDGESNDDIFDGESNSTSESEDDEETQQLDGSEDEAEEDDDEDGEDDTQQDEQEGDEDAKSVKSDWSDFNARKLVPNINENEVQDNTRVSGWGDPEQGYEHTTDSFVPDDEGEDEEGQENELPRARTVFVPVPPEDWVPPTRPFRDPAEMANNRLPFMTPITERTEVSLELELEARRDQFKTPSRNNASILIEEDEDDEDLEALSSPLRDLMQSPRLLGPLQPKPAISLTKSSGKKPLAQRGPIIREPQCNPVDEILRREILANIQPPLASCDGFYDHRHEKFERGGEIRRYAKAFMKHSKERGEKTGSLPPPVAIEFPDVESTYTVKRELGAGAYAPVYLVENSSPEEDEQDENAVAHMGKGSFAVSHRSEIEALKMENPPSAWEFHMLRLAHNRVGPQDRAATSMTYAHEMHLYHDEAFLFLPFHPHGTLLDVINLFRSESSGVMEEQLAMFFAIELLRTIEALHAKDILHGDIKPDNCLLRIDSFSELASQWRADGAGGWASRGIVLIDFGRGIDMKNFLPNVQFIADWKTTPQDCAEMREGRPWTWQIDYHGLAGAIHALLFGKYIETIRMEQGGLGLGRKYRIRESLKRYWQTEIWGDCFDMLLNPGAEMPVLGGMREVRKRMEGWLEANCERGVGLKSMIGRVEMFAKGRRT